MKKILASLILILFLTGLIAPVNIEAQTFPPDTPKEECTIKYDLTKIDATCVKGATVKVGMCCLFNAIYTVSDYVFYVVLLLSVIMLVIGGGIYITAAGDPAKTEKGRGIIRYSIIGLILAFLAKLFPGMIKFIVGLG